MSYKRIYDSDEIMVDYDGQKLRISVFEDGHWVGEHFVELPELEPVVHAHWVPDEGCGSPYGVLVISSCSNCGGQVSHHGYSCPDERCKHCGAHMDEEVADG